MARTSSAVDLIFHDYTRYITTEFLDKFGLSYSNQENTRNTWRDNYPYSADAERYLIAKSITFLATLSRNNSNNTQPDFLRSLTREMADYLSKYTMHKFPLPDNNKGRKLVRNRAKAELHIKLYDDCWYIKNLLAKQKTKREKRYRNPHYREEQKRADRMAAAVKDLRIAKDVSSMFIEVSQYRGPKR